MEEKSHLGWFKFLWSYHMNDLQTACWYFSTIYLQVNPILFSMNATSVNTGNCWTPPWVSWSLGWCCLPTNVKDFDESLLFLLSSKFLCHKILGWLPKQPHNDESPFNSLFRHGDQFADDLLLDILTKKTDVGIYAPKPQQKRCFLALQVQRLVTMEAMVGLNCWMMVLKDPNIVYNMYMVGKSSCLSTCISTYLHVIACRINGSFCEVAKSTVLHLKGKIFQHVP